MTLHTTRFAGHSFTRQQSRTLSISLLGGEDWSKVTRSEGRNAHGFVLELDGEQANLSRAHVLHRMRWQRL